MARKSSGVVATRTYIARAPQPTIKSETHALIKYQAFSKHLKESHPRVFRVLKILDQSNPT